MAKKAAPAQKRKEKKLNVKRVSSREQKPRTLTLADLTDVSGGKCSCTNPPR